ncbi:hypothetical protein [Jonesia denitrificans]|uniref:hypothetical protein n=1 Tax=Jonesia denitrificans TaxID=43674 RepID=UPI000310018A|nr:hypothetical protein [Jonesia denitrificans]ASE08311.1 N-acetyltransferase [Jonesia denitrificans]QXB42913.1 N-acetyltransferase [Jonesia denitrificans]
MTTPPGTVVYTLTNWADTTHPDHGLLRAGVELSHREAEAFHGHPDFSEPFEGIFAEACRGEYYDRDFVVLRDDAPDGEVRGFLQVLYPLSDNTHLGFVWSEAQGRDTDLTVALLAEAERLAAARGRTSIMEWTDHREAADGEPVLDAATGAGRINPTDSLAAAYLACGWELEQTERHSILPLPVDQEMLDRFAAQSRAVAHPAYELVSWVDRTPDELLAGHARLNQAMSTDVPHGELDMEETVHTPERVRYNEDTLAAANKGYLAVAARHCESGEIVGFTRVDYPHVWPEAVFQAATLVLDGHRGHRLGMWMKADLLTRLRELRPDARRLHTWNASENDHMLSINVALGFEVRTVVAAWQKKLTPIHT